MFNHVQLHVHWMHLLSTRICRYTCIYIYITYSTNTIVLPCRCMTLKWSHTDVCVMSSRRIDVILTSCACWVGPRQVCKKLSDLRKWNLLCSVRCISNKIWTQITSFFICSAWLYVKELEKIMARTHCFMHRSFFRPNYIFNNDVYFLDFCAQKFPLIFFNVNPF